MAASIFLVIIMLALSGCTSNKFVPCCMKDRIFYENGTARPNPECVFQNESAFSATPDCLIDANASGVVFCANGVYCTEIRNQDLCEKTSSCLWNATLFGPNCTGGLARWALPVCSDRVPKSCVNDKCSAMMCGYTNLRPAPPPASQDWDANKSKSAFDQNPTAIPNSAPVSDLVTPTIGLQGVTCDFKVMNQKLYNQVKSSRGALWVNSFRFGVGNSFADYEAARNFFPATDRLCAANPYATVDRFTTYIKSYDTYCKNVSAYYTCKKSGVPYLPGLAFWDNGTCNLYCGGGEAPFSCVNAPGTPRYKCNQDGFVYENESTCNLKCSIIDDPNACANDSTQFPFLQTDWTDQAHYRMKYVVDYMTDAIGASPGGAAPCINVAQPLGNKQFPFWSIGSPTSACDDYSHNWPRPYTWTDGPWLSTYNCNPSDGCNGPFLGEQRTYFDNRGYSAVDFDYDYYKKKLLEQYPYDLTTQRLAFECESSSDCLSGTCDTTYYKRGMCTNARTNLSMSCYCSSKTFDEDGGSQTPYPSCWFTNDGGAQPMFANANVRPDASIWVPELWDQGGSKAVELWNNGPLFAAAHSDHQWYDNRDNPTSNFTYYALAGNDYRNVTHFPPFLFEYACNVTPIASANSKPVSGGSISGRPVSYKVVPKCIFHDRYWDEGNDAVRESGWVIKDPDPGDGMCHYTVMGSQGSCNPNCDNDFRVHYNPAVYCWAHSCNTDHMDHFGFPGPSHLDNFPFFPKYYYEYRFELDSPDTSNQVHAGQFGTCKLNSKFDESGTVVPGSAPYLVLKDLGWCAGCSYATLAVQKVSWGQPNPGGVGSPRAVSCYEYRADFNYVPQAVVYPYGGWVGENPQSIYDGQLRWGGISTPSTQIVTRDSNPSAYQYAIDGNIGQTGSGMHAVYQCADGWHANYGWWVPSEIPTPSAPYLKEKLTSYLQSNTMPILDEIAEKTNVGAASSHTCTRQMVGGYLRYECPLTTGTYYNLESVCNAACYSAPTFVNKGYNPLAICSSSFGGRGGVLHVVADSGMLGFCPVTQDYGSIMPGMLSATARSYLGYTSLPDTQIISFACEDGKNATIARTDMLKKKCEIPPLVGLEILPDETLFTLIGSGDLSDPANLGRGKLHQFFFDSRQPAFAARVARGTPDKAADEVDLLMQDWYPMCQIAGTTTPGEKEVYEIEARMDFSRALLGNFSKSSLIWKFSFPLNSNCNKTFFLDYLFNSTGAMVDAGLIGIIYSDWTNADGKGYGPTYRTYDDRGLYTAGSYNRQHDFSGNLDTGLSIWMTRKRGTDSNPVFTHALNEMSTGKGELFCALEKYSKRVLGIIPLTYGQKLYAENQTCYCNPCTDYDYMNGVCSLKARLAPTDQSLSLDQRFCNDGALCSMPTGASGQEFHYKCEPRCMNYTACKICNSSTFQGDASFCRITQPGANTFGYSWNYSNMSDTYWEFLAGLSPSEKCCLQSNSSEGQEGSKYTYVKLTGSKQQSEFLQFPRRGEYDIDCGRSPDTSVLSYCGIRIPISQKEIACMRINRPAVPIIVTQTLPGATN